MSWHKIRHTLWNLPAFIDRWRVWPRAFITIYIWMLYKVTEWFIALPDPNMAQAAALSIIIGAGAAWFGLYINSGNNKDVKIPDQPKPVSTADLLKKDPLAGKIPSKIEVKTTYKPKVKRTNKKPAKSAKFSGVQG